MKHLVVAAAMLVGFAAPASAVVFNFGDGSNTENTVTLSEGGLSLEASGYGGFASSGGFPGGVPNGTLTNINRNANGWGVNNGGSGLIDVGDALHFDFGPNIVTLLEVTTFDITARGPLVRLYADGIARLGLNPADAPGASTETFDFSGLGLSGSSFTFGSDFGAVRIQSMEVALEAPAVPVPAAGLMALVGLAGLFAVGRRKATV